MVLQVFQNNSQIKSCRNQKCLNMLITNDKKGLYFVDYFSRYWLDDLLFLPVKVPVTHFSFIGDFEMKRTVSLFVGLAFVLMMGLSSNVLASEPASEQMMEEPAQIVVEQEELEPEEEGISMTDQESSDEQEEIEDGEEIENGEEIEKE